MAKTKPLSPVAQEILEFLAGSDKPLTLAEIKEEIPNANSAHLVAIRKRGLAEGVQVEREQVVVQKRKVLEYSAVPQVEDNEDESDE